jgi:hypothetical protein
VYKGFHPTQAEMRDIIHFVVSRPYHINIGLVVMSTAQASSTIVKKSLSLQGFKQKNS